MAGPAPAAFAQNRVEGGTDGERHAFVVGEERQGQRHHAVDRPGVQTPVVHHRAQRHVFRLRGVGLHVQRGAEPVGVVTHRLRHAPEHQADAHAGGEQHREPGQGGEIRPGVLATQADLTDGKKNQGDTEQNENIGADHEQPVKVVDGPALGTVEGRLGLGGKNNGTDHEYQDQYRTDEEDRIVHVHAKDLHIILTHFIVCFVFHAHGIAPFSVSRGAGSEPDRRHRAVGSAGPNPEAGPRPA